MLALDISRAFCPEYFHAILCPGYLNKIFYYVSWIFQGHVCSRYILPIFYLLTLKEIMHFFLDLNLGLLQYAFTFNAQCTILGQIEYWTVS